MSTPSRGLVKKIRLTAVCHPDRRHSASGLCHPCYKYLLKIRAKGRSSERRDVLEKVVREEPARRAHDEERLLRERAADRHFVYKRKNRHKRRAQTAVAKAIGQGLLKKPGRCDEPGCEETKIEFHHTHGYEPENWLVGRFLCRRHHFLKHRDRIQQPCQSPTASPPARSLSTDEDVRSS